MCEAKQNTLHTHSQGNIKEVFVCRYVQEQPESMAPPQKNKQNQGKEEKVNKIKIVCCGTYYVPEMIFLS
jgi:hypothetical protein